MEKNKRLLFLVVFFFLSTSLAVENQTHEYLTADEYMALLPRYEADLTYNRMNFLLSLDYHCHPFLWNEGKSIDVEKASSTVDVLDYPIPSDLPADVYADLSFSQDMLSGISALQGDCLATFSFTEDGWPDLLGTRLQTTADKIKYKVRSASIDETTDWYEDKKTREFLEKLGFRFQKEVYKKTVCEDPNNSSTCHTKKIIKYSLHGGENLEKKLDEYLKKTNILYTIGSTKFSPISEGPFALWVLTSISESTGESWKSCSNYTYKYKMSWDYLWNATIEAEKEWEESLQTLTEAYANASEAGMCREDFVGSSVCREMAERLENNVRKGEHTIRELVENVINESKIEEPKDEIRWIPMSMFWNLTFRLSLAANQSRELINKYKRALYESKEKLSESLSKYQSLTEKMREAKEEALNEKCDVVDNVSVASKGGVERVSTPAKDLNKLSNILLDIETSSDYLNEILQDWDAPEKREGWLYYSLNLTKKIDEEIAMLPGNITENCEKAVNATYKLAKKVIDGLKAAHYPEESIKALEEKLNESRKRATLGDRYLGYQEVIKLASMVRANDSKKLNELKAIVDEVQALIERAKKDDIDTANIESEFERYLAEDTSYTYKIKMMESLKNSIYHLAREKYLYLEDKYEEIEEKINSFPELLEPEKDLLMEKTAGYFRGGSIYWPAAIGHLKTLDEDLETIKEKIEEKIEDAKEDYIKVFKTGEDSSIKAALGEEAIVTMLVCIKNTYKAPFEDIEKEIKLPINIDHVEAEEGDVTIEGKKLVWDIKYLDYGESVCANVSGVVKPSTIDEEREERWIIDRNGFLKKEVNFTVSKEFILDVVSTVEELLKGYSYKDYAAKIDGRSVDSSQHLDKGIHTLTVQIEASGKEAGEQFASVDYWSKIENVNGRTVVHNYANITPVIDLNRAYMSLNGNITEGEEREGSYVLIRDLKKGITYIAEAVEVTDNSRDMVEEILREIENYSLTQEEEWALQDIYEELNNGFVEKALEDAKALREAIRQRLMEEAEQNSTEQKKIDEINKTLIDINAAENVSSPLQEELEEKARELEDVLRDKDKLRNFETMELKKWLNNYVKTTSSQLESEFRKISRELAKEGLEDDESIYKFKSYIRKAKSTNSLRALSQAAAELEKLKRKKESIEARKREAKSQFEKIYQEVQEKALEFAELERKAKKAGVAEYLSYTGKYIRDLIKQYSKPKSIEQYKTAAKELEKIGKMISESKMKLKRVASDELESAASLLRSRQVPEEKWKGTYNKGKEKLKEGDYIEVLSIAKKMREAAMEYKPKDPFKEERNLPIPWVLGAIALAGVAALAYLYKDSIFAKKEVKRRKIKKLEDNE